MKKQAIRIVAVSGGFDPVHIGHVRMFEKAKALGTHLVVILNCDKWLKRKKKFAFMPEKERAEIIKKFAVVDDVYIHHSDDSHVSGALKNYKMKIGDKEHQINIFANGGDRKDKNDIPETEVCEKGGIEMIFNVGSGGKVQSSSWLTKAVIKTQEDARPWGSTRVLESEKNWRVKRITVKAGKRLSWQSHSKRSELWACVEGEVDAERGVMENGKPKITEKRALTAGDRFFIKQNEPHRLSSKKGGAIIEVAFGEPIEEDIKRYEDDYNRA